MIGYISHYCNQLSHEPNLFLEDVNISLFLLTQRVLEVVPSRNKGVVKVKGDEVHTFCMVGRC